MSHLKDKKILLGLTGSIACYKSAELVRLLKLAGAQVKVVMTRDAAEFITPLSLQALSGQPVHMELLDHDSEASMSHIALAKWADLLLVAPATANILAKFSAGIADDLLSTLYLACASPAAIVPAMNQQMWQHPATVNNYKTLIERGVYFLGPSFGQQACGDIGPGRMVEPNEIISYLNHYFAPKCLTGFKILITAGPTREPIDPVRYISNYSSGKMGYALADAVRELGAETYLISGPTYLPPPFDVQTLYVETANDMHYAVMQHLEGCHIFIAAAAVADFSVTHTTKQKIKKSSLPTIELKKNTDILTEVSQCPNRPFLVGFAAETENLVINAKEKLQNKKLDMIIANQIGVENSGFHSDFNTVSVLIGHQQIDFPPTAKKELAREIIQLITSEFQRKQEAAKGSKLSVDKDKN